jgi:hypothetical protein
MKGNLVHSLASGTHGAGRYSIPLDKNRTGISINPGAYVVKLATSQGVQADEVVVK